MENLSVAFFSHSSDLGGAERCLLDLVNPLSESGVDCTVILPKKSGCFKDFLFDGVDVFEATNTWWWVFGRKRLKSISRFFRSWLVIETEVLPFLRKLDPDIVFSQTIVSPWGIYCAERLGKPHALSVSEFGKLDHNLDFIFGYKNSMRLLYGQSDAVFWITKTVRDEFFKFLSDSVSPKIEEIIYDSIELEYQSKALSIENNKFKIGIFGRVCESKGQEDLVRAVLELKKKNINVECYIVGDSGGGYSEGIKDFIKNNRIEDSVKVIKHLDNPYDLMNDMNVIISCSRNEAMGRTLIEAALLNIPIIFPNCGGPAEIFMDQVHGLSFSPGNFVELAEKITEVFKYKDLAMGRAIDAKKYVVDKFSRENYFGSVKSKLMVLKDRKFHEGKKREVIEFLFNNKNIKFDVFVFSKLYQWIYKVFIFLSFEKKLQIKR